MKTSSSLVWPVVVKYSSSPFFPKILVHCHCENTNMTNEKCSSCGSINTLVWFRLAPGHLQHDGDVSRPMDMKGVNMYYTILQISRSNKKWYWSQCDREKARSWFRPGNHKNTSYFHLTGDLWDVFCAFLGYTVLWISRVSCLKGPICHA